MPIFRIIIFISFAQVPMVVIYSFTICHRNSPTPIWPPRSCRSATFCRPKCSLTNKRICPSALALCRTIMRIRHRQPFRQCTVFRLGPNDLRCNWNDPKKPQSHIKNGKHFHQPYQTGPSIKFSLFVNRILFSILFAHFPFFREMRVN